VIAFLTLFPFLDVTQAKGKLCGLSQAIQLSSTCRCTDTFWYQREEKKARIL